MPGGRKKPGRRPRESNARRAKKRGPQAQREQRPKGKKNPFQKWPGPQAHKNILSWQQATRPEGKKIPTPR